MRACCAPLCVLSVRPPDDRDERIVNRYWGKKENASNVLTSSFIGGSDLYATRFSDRFRAFLYILCTLIFFEGVRGMGGGGNGERFLFRLSRRCSTHGKIMESRAQIGIVSSFFQNQRILFTNRLMFPILSLLFSDEWRISFKSNTRVRASNDQVRSLHEYF